MLSVVRNGSSAPGDYQPWGADVVVGREPAPHEQTSDSLEFHPRAGDEGYTIWLRVGGGGGHSIRVDNLQASCLEYRQSDNADARCLRAFVLRHPDDPEVQAALGAIDRGPLGLSLWLDFEVEIGRRVPPSCFSPQPRVVSRLVHLRRLGGHREVEGSQQVHVPVIISLK